MADINDDNEVFAVREVRIDILGITPYSPSKASREKEKGESWDDYEASIWRGKAHQDNGVVFIPGTAFKLCLDEATQNLNEKIPGKGNQTWTGVIKMGVAPMSDVCLGVKVDDLRVEKVHCHANGKRLPGPRVTRWFPMLHDWHGTLTMRIFNDSLTSAKFEEFFSKAGLLAGVGRGRPSTGSPIGNGRFRVKKFVWAQVS